jgi:hypothetical protein
MLGTETRIEKTQYRGRAVLITSNKELIVYRASGLYIYNLHTDSLIKKIKLPIALWKRWISKIRIFERVLHLEVRWAIEIEKNIILVQFDHMVLNINLSTGKTVQEKVPVKGNSLSVCKIHNLEEFDNQIVIGDYSRNADRDEVKLFSRNKDGNWKVIYSFEKGKVKHIHSCVTDSEKKCVYILTGDLNSESGIWIATNNFAIVEPLFVGSQTYRACQLFNISGRFYYASDAPSEPNYLYKIDGKEVMRLNGIDGTCIYGIGTEDYAYISTTCEPEAIAKNKIEYWLSNKPGKGIIGHKVSVGIITNDGTYKKIKEFEHDMMPLRLFQYGMVVFTNIVDDVCYITSLCVKKNDYRIFRLDKK